MFFDDFSCLIVPLAVIKCFAVSSPAYFGVCVLKFGQHKAHYISKKDIFLIATGVAYPPDAIGLHIWQTIESIGEPCTNALSLTRSGWSMVRQSVVLICGAVGTLVILLLSMQSEWTASVLLFRS